MTAIPIEYLIATTTHDAIWPQGVILFWGPNRCGYTTLVDNAGRYTEKEARHICQNLRAFPKPVDFMIRADLATARSVRVVDLDALKELADHSHPQLIEEAASCSPTLQQGAQLLEVATNGKKAPCA